MRCGFVQQGGGSSNSNNNRKRARNGSSRRRRQQEVVDKARVLRRRGGLLRGGGRRGCEICARVGVPSRGRFSAVPNLANLIVLPRLVSTVPVGFCC